MDWVGNAPHGVVLPYNYFSKQQWDEHFQRAGLKEKYFNKDVPLYPAPLSVIFARQLHLSPSSYRSQVRSQWEWLAGLDHGGLCRNVHPSRSNTAEPLNNKQQLAGAR